MLKEIRFLWSVTSPRWKRIVRVCWPAWTGAAVILVVGPFSGLLGRGPTFAVGLFAITLMGFSYWRLRPLMAELFAGEEDREQGTEPPESATTGPS